ncbi:MAG TPA: phosphoribosyl-AMP cyclohydrolase [Gammaproteobacteria bacterium]|nr:phosphoribosyl-AMP cyclohydrolase [Gammaproteobacteria bacterium]
MKTSWLDNISWPQDGLLPVIAQDAGSGEVLMLAWMNREALETSVNEGRAVYWSRSRQALWRKGEESGHIQKLLDVYLDCDADTILIKVEQLGGIACHTGRANCFFNRLKDDNWQIELPILKDPKNIYGK